MPSNTDYKIADISLAAEGRKKIDWARQYMPVMRLLHDRASAGGAQPLAGHTIACCMHLEAKTACLLLTLKELGAEVAAAGSNPLSTQDAICAALAEAGIHVYSRHGMSSDEYSENIALMLGRQPDIVIDDGADTIAMLVERYPELMSRVIGGCEETTTGVNRLRAMDAEGILKFPMLAVNDAFSKYLFDNRYGTGQSVWAAIMSATNCVIAGKHVVVAGYGWCGKGVARRADGLGARVIVCEVDPHRALEAHMDGFDVMSVANASEIGDIFVTVTGGARIFREEHFKRMKDGVILSNAGHFDVEICIPDLEKMAARSYESRDSVMTYEMNDKKRIHLLGDGRLVNLAAGDGHPIEIMDMSFATQLLCALHIASRPAGLGPGLHSVPAVIDRAVASAKLDALGIEIEQLTQYQEDYISDWR